MRRIEYPIGTRFGRLVITDNLPTVNGAAVVRCSCDCGGEWVGNPTNLKRGTYKSCGCVNAEKRIPIEAGQRFGRLVVSAEIPNKGKRRQIKCRCDCGSEWIGTPTHLASGLVTSCGCYNRERAKERATKHGLYDTRLYVLYDNMIRRCENPKDKYYHVYGGRGISVCNRWRNDREEFYRWCLANGYQEGLQLHREDNDGGYSPDNCRFVTGSENCRHKSTNHNIMINGEAKTVVEWSKTSGVDESTIRQRIKRGWSGDDVLLPVRAPRSSKVVMIL